MRSNLSRASRRCISAIFTTTITSGAVLDLNGHNPDSFLAADDAHSLALRRDFIRTYLERDVPMFGPRIPAETLERFWTMLAHSQGGLLNASKLASGIGVSAQRPVTRGSRCGASMSVKRVSGVMFFSKVGWTKRRER